MNFSLFQMLIWVILFSIILYLLWRLRRLGDEIRGYKSKNQEGVGAWTKSRNQAFLLLAAINSVYFVLDWLSGGFQLLDLCSVSVMVGLPLYFYFFGDEIDR